MRTLTLAQVGCGYWGPNLLRVFSGLPGARMKWLCDRKPGRLDWARQRHPALRLTRDFDEILDDPEVDAVVVATEVVAHHALAAAALRAGKHVFVEKPLAHSARLAAELARLAARRRRVLAVGHVFLYHPAFRVLRAQLVPGKLGRLRYVDMVRVNPGPPRPRHDVIWDMAPHDAAMALDLAASPPVSVRASGLRWRLPVDEAAFFEIRFKSGVLARVHVSWLSSRRVRRVEAYAENGAAFYDDSEPVEKLKIVLPGEDTRVRAKAGESATLYYGPGRTIIPALSKDEPLALECADFLAAIRRGRAPCSGAEIGVQVVRVLAAAALSAAAGGKEIRL
ncbi:MAG: Gfo/Idh/MocA family oxidoreductase [Elusimicrobia bacterium]|nr:Gfo/Idh/MocA family oxidoreductase [Elusimicrobiota bacterium]